MGVLDLVGDVFSEVPSVELAEQLRKVINSLIAPSLTPESPAGGDGDAFRHPGEKQARSRLRNVVQQSVVELTSYSPKGGS